MKENDLIKNRDIIMVGQQAWDMDLGGNCKNIALEFCKHNRVLFVNPPLDRISKMRHKADPKVQKRLSIIAGKQNGLEEIQPNLWNLYPDKLVESINWLKSRGVFNYVNKINNKKLAQSIQLAVNKLGFKDFILFNDNDMFRSFYLKELLKPKVSIYYSRDYMLGVDYWKFHGTKLEPELIAKSDLCMANSTYLANYCGKYNKRSYYVGQGCDLDIFTNPKDKSIPSDIIPIKKPVIGYVGALQSIRLDIELLAFIALKKPEWSIVLVGPEDDVFKKSILHGFKNIHFLGSKPPASLPAYINSFDVCLNPQIVNEVTIGNYPRKIDEYLAMGKPVVATRTEAMSIFNMHTYLAASNEDYLELIAIALGMDSPELQTKRRTFAASHTWANNVKEIYKVINDFEAGRG